MGAQGLESMCSSTRVNLGLLSHVEYSDMAGHVVAELVGFAKNNVPMDQLGESENRLMATAGVRLVKDRDHERILNAYRSFLRPYGFRLSDDWAAVTSVCCSGAFFDLMGLMIVCMLGLELDLVPTLLVCQHANRVQIYSVGMLSPNFVGTTSLPAWIVANYALGTLGAYPSHTIGIIELGSASAQVTSLNSLENQIREFYTLYSHNLL
ncbi:hypothetical protein OROGR_027816 [Orobanche gracilis]